MRYAPIMPIVLLVAACEVEQEDGAGSEVRTGSYWQGSLSLHAERRERESDSRASINSVDNNQGSIVEFDMKPCYEDDRECYIADVTGLTVTCTHDSTNVYQTSNGEEKTVSTASVTGDAEAEVLMDIDREEGGYVLSVNFFGPEMPIRVRRYVNGELDSDETTLSSCDFGHEVRRPLPEDPTVRSGEDDWKDAPWYSHMEWHLESGSAD